MTNKINYASLFRNELNDHGISFIEKPSKSGTLFAMDLSGESIKQLRVTVLICECGLITFRSFPAHNISDAKQQQLFPLFNELSKTVRITKFKVDADNDLCCEMDYILYEGKAKAVSQHLMLLLLLFVTNIDKALAKILPIICAEKENFASDELHESEGSFMQNLLNAMDDLQEDGTVTTK